ncbi:MAG: MurR/RpiR family transcriptional regulator [Lachnospiraceae bacterium]|nr:MurR/RpiR family transcriptional regulator [Lachnospiraceae bacterium]
MENDILFTIREKMPHMSKSHRRIAQYVLEHYDEAAFDTAAKIGKRIGASESTVVRFAVAIGYAGYPEYQKALGDALRNRLSGVKKLDEQYGQNSQAEMIRRVMTADIMNIQKTVENINPSEFEKAIDMLLDAEHVYVVGLRGSKILATILCHYLKMARKHVVLIFNDSAEEIVELLLDIGENDCLMGISFPEYSDKTIKAMEIACDRGANVISVTDDEKSPVNMYSNCALYAKSDSVSVVSSMVAPMSLMNALAVSVCVRRMEEVGNNIGEIKAMLDSYNYPTKDEMKNE